MAAAPEIALTLPNDVTVSAVLEELQWLFPAQRELLERCALAVNAEYVERDCIVHEGDAIAVIPPVSGGS